MSFIFSLVPLLPFHFFISSIHADLSSYPLVHNPNISKTYTKFDLESIQSIIYPVFSACPAQSDEEKELIDKQLIDRKALFIKKFYTEDIIKKGIKWCEKNFEIAVVINIKEELAIIEFGYQVYFDNSEKPEEFRNMETSSLTEYTSITGQHLFTKIPSLAEDKPLSFKWIKNNVLNYDVNYEIVVKITYDLHRIGKGIRVQCNDNNLGMEYFKQGKEKFYEKFSKDNMKNIFNEFETPEESNCQSTANGCLEKYNLLKPHHFQTNFSAPVSCSDLTSILIWSEVNEKLLNYSELFLTAISEITDRKLIITSGIYQVLSLSRKNQSNDEIESEEIYLDPSNGRIPVPQIIYKIVSYKSHDCNDKTDVCWFNMVIAIHNEHKITKKLCPVDKCEEWGWENIQYMNTSATGDQSKYIYCCSLDDDLETTLKYKKGAHKRADLNLKHFPVYNEKEGKNDFEDRREEFLGIMDTLLKELKASHGI